ncbi:MAG: bifunctional DNA primase/polymerase, partial [Chloroflexota bacterium]|nr:bifunctional DNA primase/polymerase [Chloroflexota bacterium]
MDTLQFARWYARRGIHVFPCHTIEEGKCTCRNPSCTSPGKHPIGNIVPHGVTEATTDPQTIDQWWALFPDANLGLATGFRSGINVVDIDPDKGGEDSWENLERLHEPVDDTWWVETGSGGYHIYFSADDTVRNSASLLGPGIDVRGEGGYVIAPPSRHATGGAYAWSTALNHKTLPNPAPMPEWLVQRLSGGRRVNRDRALTNPLPERITEGGRNVWMSSIAGSMRRRGMSLQAIESALKIENRLKCEPRLDDREIERIAASID